MTHTLFNIKCDTFDIKSKEVLKYERKYYLAYLSIYYALNTGARINYGPFYKIDDMYPRFLIVLDMVLQKNVNGIRNVNIPEFFS